MILSSLKSSTPFCKCLDCASVSKNGTTVCTVNDLIQFVCDNNRCQSLFLKFHKQVQKHLCIFIIQGWSRLIQDEQFNIFWKSFSQFSTSCCLPVPISLIRVWADSWRPTWAMCFSASLYVFIPVDGSSFYFLISFPRNMFSPMESSGINASSWWIITIPFASLSLSFFKTYTLHPRR